MTTSSRTSVDGIPRAGRSLGLYRAVEGRSSPAPFGSASVSIGGIRSGPPQLLPDHPVRNLQKLFFGPRRNRRAGGPMVTAALASHGQARGLHDGREVESAGHELSRRSRRDLDAVFGLGDRDGRPVL